MAEHYLFFDSTFDDVREYGAPEFLKYFRTLVTTGLMKGAGNLLKVTTDGGGMVTTVDTGIAFLLGHYYENDALKDLSHDTETLGKSRIDRIVIRLDLSTEVRKINAVIKKGVGSATPVVPALTQNEMVYELSVAQVKVVGGQTYISASDVTDERGIAGICPYAGSNILPNFDADGLQEVIDKVEGMYQLTDMQYAKTPLTLDYNDLVESGIYHMPDKGALNAPPQTGAGGTQHVTVIVSRVKSANGEDAVYQLVIGYSGTLHSRSTSNLANKSWWTWYAIPRGLTDSYSNGAAYLAASGKGLTDAYNALNNAKAGKVVSMVSVPGFGTWGLVTYAFKTENNMVTLSLDGYGGTTTRGTQIGTLPVGYRPSRSWQCPITTANVATDTSAPPCTVNIMTDGSIRLGFASRASLIGNITFSLD